MVSILPSRPHDVVHPIDVNGAEHALLMLLRRASAGDFTVTIMRRGARWSVMQSDRGQDELMLAAGDTFDEAWSEAGIF